MTLPRDEIEQLLLPRLRVMGYILILFSCIAFIWSLFIDPPSPIDTPGEMELSSGFTLLSVDNRINIYGVATIFSVAGAACILFAIKRSRR